jgi:hypothetical protein
MEERTLNEDELRELRQYWEDPHAFDAALRALFPEDVKRTVRARVLSAMEAEGKIFVPGTKNRWGGERAKRELAVFRAHFAAPLSKQRDAIRSAVCEGLRYCERKRSREFQGDYFNLALMVADALLAVSGVMPFPVTAVTVYVVRYGFLDELCGC